MRRRQEPRWSARRSAAFAVAEGDGLSFSYEWVRSSETEYTTLAGATGEQYVATEADVGGTILCGVKVRNGGGYGEGQSENGIQVVPASPPVPPDVTPPKTGRIRIVCERGVGEIASGPCSVRVTATDAESGVAGVGFVVIGPRGTLRLDGRAADAPTADEGTPTTWTALLPRLRRGRYVFLARGVDAAGNRARVATSRRLLVLKRPLGVKARG